MNIMNVSTLNFNTVTPINNRLQNCSLTQQNNRPVVNKLGAFPKYYCSNINFNGSKFGSIDFDYDFFKVSHEIVDNNLDKMELTKDLTEEEQEDFRNNLFSSDKMTLAHFMLDKKPSILLNGEYPYFQNNDKYSFVRRTIDIPLRNNKTYLSNNIFILNNELVKQTIDENKELYTKRMGLDENSSTEEIFEELKGENSPLKQQEGFDDIIGITLGFSPINSILFQVEQDIPDKLETRPKRIIHANKLDKAFNSENSVYKDFSDEFKADVQSSIDYVKDNYFRAPDLGQIGYAYIHLAPDEKHTQKIIKNAEDIVDDSDEVTR